MLFEKKKKRKWKQSTDICYNVGKPQKSYAKWKKSDIADHIMYITNL